MINSGKSIITNCEFTSAQLDGDNDLMRDFTNRKLWIYQDEMENYLMGICV